MTRLPAGHWTGGAGGGIDAPTRFYERAHPTLCRFPSTRVSVGSRLKIDHVQRGLELLKTAIERAEADPRARMSSQTREMTGGEEPA